LSQVGVTLTDTGKLAFDQGKFDEQIDADFEGVRSLFTRLRRLEISTELDDLRGGNGLDAITGDNDFRIFLGNGESIDVAIGNSDTLGDLLNRINLDVENGGQLDASIDSDGFSMQLVDNSTAISRALEAGTTTTFTDNDIAGTYDDDFFNGATVTFTSGANAGEVRSIVDYDGATGQFTLDSGDPLSVAPTAGDSFEISRAFQVKALNGSKVASQLGISKTLDLGKTVLTGNILTATGHPGIGHRIKDRLDFLTRTPDGAIPTRAEGIDTTIEGFEDDIEKMEERIKNKELRLVREFTRLEQILASSQNTMQQLQGSLAGLSGLGG
jgi:flagellar capping protein FliD